MGPEPLCCDFTFLQHEVCSDYFIHQHIHGIESFDLFGMKVQVTQYHMYFNVHPLLQRTLLPLISEPQCFKLELT
jgi:hypothetical protein